MSILSSFNGNEKKLSYGERRKVYTQKRVNAQN